VLVVLRDGLLGLGSLNGVLDISELLHALLSNVASRIVLLPLFTLQRLVVIVHMLVLSALLHSINVVDVLLKPLEVHCSLARANHVLAVLVGCCVTSFPDHLCPV
jgi:hypothetical protein